MSYSHITPGEDILQEALNMQSFLEIECSNDPEEAKERLSTLAAFNARSGKLLADAKYWYNDRYSLDLLILFRHYTANAGPLSATIMNRLAATVCKDQSYLVDWMERINRATVHQMDGLRTILSLAKAEMLMTPNLTT
jgi:hypothetical protein